MIGRNVAFAVSATWLGQAIRIGLNLVGLPIMFRYMSEEELGIWLVLGQSSVLLSMLIEAGLTPTLTRRIAFVVGKSRSGPGQALDEDSRRELATLVKSGEITYRILALGVFAVTFLLGSLYLWHLPLQQVSTTTVWIAWVLLCFGYATMMWSGLWTALTNGLGYVAVYSSIAAVFGIATVAIQILVVLAGGGLIWLAIVAIAGGIAFRFGLRLHVQRQQPLLLSMPGSWDASAVRSMMAPSVKSWLTAAGSLALFKADQFFIAMYIDAARVPAYYAAFTLLHNLAILSLTLGQASSVFVSQMWHTGALETIHRIVLRSLRVSLILVGCGVATLLVSGSDLIGVWVGADHFVGYPVLAILSVTFVLCVQQNGLLAFSRATENEVYATAFVAAGCLNVVLAWILVQQFGMLGVVIATLVAQSLTSNWVVLVDGLRRLKLKPMVYVRACVVPFFVVSLAAVLAMLPIAQNRSLLPTALERGFVTLAIGGCVCLVSLWLFGLTAEERAQVSQRLRKALGRGRARSTGTRPLPIPND